jgi:hypothetical protein
MQLLYFQVFVVFHASHRFHRFGLFSHVFREFFKVFFAPDPLKNEGFSGGILLIRDRWAMGMAGLSGFLVVAAARTNSRCVFGPAAAVKASR